MSGHSGSWQGTAGTPGAGMLARARPACWSRPGGSWETPSGLPSCLIVDRRRGRPLSRVSCPGRRCGEALRAAFVGCLSTARWPLCSMQRRPGSQSRTGLPCSSGALLEGPSSRGSSSPPLQPSSPPGRPRPAVPLPLGSTFARTRFAPPILILSSGPASPAGRSLDISSGSPTAPAHLPRRQTLPALRAATREDLPPARTGAASQEPVLALTPALLRLIRPLHLALDTLRETPRYRT